MSEDPRRGRPDDEDIDARFAEIVAGLYLSEDRRSPESSGREPRELEPRELEPGGQELRERKPPGLEPHEHDDPEQHRDELAGPHAEERRAQPEPTVDPPAPGTWREWSDPEVEEHFIPPDPPPLPAGDLHFWGIIVGLMGGPLILFLAHGLQVLHGSVWSWLGLGLALGGFALLVLRLPTHREDDPTGGARV